MSGRKFTNSEDKFIRDHYRKMVVAEIARRLNRSERSVYQHAKFLGLSNARICLTDNQIEDGIRRYFPQGMSDSEIKSVLEMETGILVNRHRIGELRRKLNLPTNRFSDRVRQRVAEKTRAQLKSASVSSLAALRYRRFQEFKSELGWPEGLTIRAVQALEMFWQHGPLTRKQLCALMGVSSRKRTAPVSNAKGGTVLAELAAEGLIARMPKRIKDGMTKNGKPKMVSLYLLNPGVKPNGRKERTQGTKSTAIGRSAG